MQEHGLQILRICFRSPQVLGCVLGLHQFLDTSLPVHPYRKVFVSCHSFLHKAVHAKEVVEEPVFDGLGREEGGLLPLCLLPCSYRPHSNSKVLAWSLGLNLCLAGGYPLSVDVDGTSLTLALLAVVFDEHVSLSSYFTQRLADTSHRHDILRLEYNRSISEEFVA